MRKRQTQIKTILRNAVGLLKLNTKWKKIFHHYSTKFLMLKVSFIIQIFFAIQNDMQKMESH